MNYENAVDVAGQVLEADVRQKRFQLWLDDAAGVQVAFTDEQETEVTTALKDHRAVRLRVIGRGEFSPQGTLQRVISVDRLLLVRGEEPEFDEQAPAIEDVLSDLAKDVPDEEWDSPPSPI